MDINIISKVNNTEELLIFLNKIENELYKKNKLSKITKDNLLKVCKEKRNENKLIWTKDIAKKFGDILKLIKKLDKLYDVYLEDDNNVKIGLLNFFGKLYTLNSKFNTIRNDDILAKKKIRMISCGGEHICCLTDDNSVFTFGSGTFGQIGNGLFENVTSFFKIQNIPKCKWITCGYAFTMCITEEGEIYSWGAGENGRLGNGDLKDINIPNKLNTEFKSKKIFAGSVHGCLISDESEIYSWGNIKYSGHNGDKDILKPKKIKMLEDIYFHMISIGPGGYHTIALSLSGDVYVWGHNRVGQLGFKSEIRGKLSEEDKYYHQIPIKIKNLPPNILVRSISAGWGHSAILTTDGKVYLCGRNFRGQIGIDVSKCIVNSRGHPYNPKFNLLEGINEKIDKVLCGGEHTAALTKEGKLYVWGDDLFGQLGHSNRLDRINSNQNDFYRSKPYLVNVESSMGIIKDIALGFSITLFTSIKN